MAGDAAHTMTPYAGKGTNAGVQDAHNPAWKLAAVLQGRATPALLRTYGSERQPAGAFYARLSGEMAASSGLVNVDQMLKHVGSLIRLPNYTYRSAAIGATPALATAVTLLNGQPGIRLPHLWLNAAKQTSTLDWLRGEFILVATGDAPRRQGASALVASQLNLSLAVHHFPNEATRPVWEQLTTTQAGDTLLVRPDGCVALRLAATDSAEALVRQLRGLLGF